MSLIAQNSRKFHIPNPVKANRAEELVRNRYITEQWVESVARGVRGVTHGRVWNALPSFITLMHGHPNPEVREIYMRVDPFLVVQRLLRKRPVVFYTADDAYMLRDGQTGVGWTVGLPGGPSVKEYLLYDEIKFAALVGLSSFSHFINDGSRHNQGIAAPYGSVEKDGIIIGAVGARFELAGKMEWEECVVTPEQNTEANGYGRNANPNSWMTRWRRIWGGIYGEMLPTWAEACVDNSGRYHRIREGVLFDTVIYRKRILLTAETLLAEASDRGQMAGKKAYLHVVGLGLGVWQLPDAGDLQVDLYGQAWLEALRTHVYPNVSDIDFSWIAGIERVVSPMMVNQTQLHVSKRNPHDKLDNRMGEKLLVEVFAWDGNAFPGNEYWRGELTASGDPAAAASSMIAELHNPVINPCVGSFLFMTDITGSPVLIEAPVSALVLEAMEAKLRLTEEKLRDEERERKLSDQAGNDLRTKLAQMQFQLDTANREVEKLRREGASGGSGDCLIPMSTPTGTSERPSPPRSNWLVRFFGFRG